MAFRAGQPNMSRGELGPELHGRFDVDAYAAGLKKARNVIVMKYGGITKRPGTRLVAEAVDQYDPKRLIPFQFSLQQTYALEMGQAYMAPCALGGRILEEELKITNITNAATAQVTAAYHGYSIDDLIYLIGIDGSMGDFLNSRSWRVIGVPDVNNFVINANTILAGAFTGASGGVVRTATPPPPPPAPPVTPPPPPPPPPLTGGGGGGGFGGGGFSEQNPIP